MVVLENISKSFATHVVLNKVSIRFDKKEITTIIGPSGSGKTTLLRCINKLESPDSGNIFIDGKKITTKNLMLKIGMVFQGFHLFPHMNILDNLIYAPIHILAMKKNAAIKRAHELIQMFRLEKYYKQYPLLLSGGQKQRVAICRALMMSPDVILFDEPTSALDPESVKEMVDVIHLLKNTMIVIIVTHHIIFAKAVSDRVVFIDHGEILSDQNASEFFLSPQSDRAKLFLENVGL